MKTYKVILKQNEADFSYFTEPLFVEALNVEQARNFANEYLRKWRCSDFIDTIIETNMTA